MLEFGGSLADCLRVILLQLRHPYGLVKSCPERHASNSVTRGLNRSRHFLTDEHGMHAARRFFALSYGIHHFAPAIGAITASKYFGKIRLAGLRVANDNASFVQFQMRKQFF